MLCCDYLTYNSSNDICLKNFTTKTTSNFPGFVLFTLHMIPKMAFVLKNFTINTTFNFPCFVVFALHMIPQTTFSLIQRRAKITFEIFWCLSSKTLPYTPHLISHALLCMLYIWFLKRPSLWYSARQKLHLKSLDVSVKYALSFSF